MDTAIPTVPSGTTSLDHDAILRQHLHAHLTTCLSPGDRLLHELSLLQGDARADVVLLNGCTVGFEIKAARDTVRRLARQAGAYAQIFDIATLVTVEEHMEDAITLLPGWWGIWIAIPDEGGRVSFAVHREAGANPNRSRLALATLLWREEVLEKLASLGADRGIRTKPKLVLHQRLAEVMPLRELADFVRDTLKRRLNWKVD